ncbi:beta-glucosidase [Allocatelliglobosispora scoriae]|uniref:Beta-glucosidase n=1 Tax=Allocatelliglobosispora scoriae TaxID=643052 RepID=A0A841BYY7_9ACTN|nr:glycoside hydrolase family 3 C-terminal domain-containing protein [Allocatelliglobosispora scoriae]MBB5872133.1 beta-glucosidase [Allocatelliglobosispora scoriae]
MPHDREEVIEAALRALDLETKVRILAGQDMWSLPAVEEIGLASLVVSDGPIGVRGTQWSADDPSIALPSPTALAATWDPELARRAGRLLGQEAHRKGVHVLLAPTVNLHRSPLGGRHFECYSEDPLLTGAIGAAYVTGVQEQSVGTTVKHFVGNDAETERFTVDNQIGERALRELYLAPFETIVRAGAWGVMSAYNQVNGVTMSAHAELQHDLLKQEWGFDGAVVSDWFAARDAVGTANGGLDIAMPAAGSPWGEALVAAVRNGEVTEETIDHQVRRVLRLAARTGALAGADPEVPVDRRPAPIDGDALAREIAVRSFVLATNRDHALPLDPAALTSIAVIGVLARDARILGGGSAQVFPAHVISPLDGLTAALPDGVRVTYAVGADPREKVPPATGPHWTELGATFRDGDGAVLSSVSLASGTGLWMELPDGIDPEALATVEIAGRLTAPATGTHLLSIRGIGQYALTVDGETVFEGPIMPDSDDLSALFLHPPETRFPVELTEGQQVAVVLRQQVMMPPGMVIVSLTLGHAQPTGTPDELIEEAVRAAADAEVAVVVVGTTEEVESEGFDRTTLALPGRQDELVRRVVAANPRTVVVVNAGSPVELPWADEVAAVLLTWFPGQEAGHALADVLLGAAEPGGRLPTTWPVVAADCPILSTTPVDGVLAYDEGVFIGYRAWDRTAAVPRFGFGHGLGYTSWAYRSMEIVDGVATVTLRNEGDRAGREVVQLYAGPSVADGERPVRWLAGFAVVEAAAGESVTVTIPLPERTFQIWDGGWRTVEGAYAIEAAHSIMERPLSTVITIGGAR